MLRRYGYRQYGGGAVEVRTSVLQWHGHAKNSISDQTVSQTAALAKTKKVTTAWPLRLPPGPSQCRLPRASPP